MNARLAIGAVLALLGLGLLGIRAAPARESPDTAPVAAPHVHRAPAAMVDAVLEVARAFIAEDGPAAAAGLDRLEAATRPLSSEDKPALGGQMVAFDNAFHRTLNDSREFALAGQIDSAFDQFVWVQRGCRICHAQARKVGALPSSAAEPPEATPH